jgi:broad specificity phosphatase PhoE
VACLRDIAAGQDGRVLVVAHNTVIRLALCQLLGLPLREYRRLFPAIGNCALTEIRMTDGRSALLRFNVPSI